MLQICNACRYCEGYCAVFPAMTRRLEFSQADVHYLANLCHNCGACLHACQYAPPHEFGVNVPHAMARVRVQTYAEHAWPAALGALYRRNGLTLALALAGRAHLVARARGGEPGHVVAGAACGRLLPRVPPRLMVGLFAPVFAFAVLALSLSVRRFFRGMHAGPPSAAASGEAARDALTLKYLDGGQGQGCNEADDAFTLARRRAHHFTFYGFALCFAATCVATLYHYLLGQPAPYGWLSLPKLLGVSGGVAMVIGTVGLWRLNLARHALHGDAAQRPMDRGFIALLFVTAASGLALAAARTHASAGAVAVTSPGQRDGAVHHHALRQVRSWRVPAGRVAALVTRKTHAQAAGPRRRLKRPHQRNTTPTCGPLKFTSLIALSDLAL